MRAAAALLLAAAIAAVLILAGRAGDYDRLYAELVDGLGPDQEV